MTRLILTLIAALWVASGAQADALRLAVTTSFHNSGLADLLLPQITDDTGLEVQLLVVGTGQALRLSRSGDVDAILVHDLTSEEAHVAAGHATHRREIMYNDFVVIGPAADPASLRQTETASAAFSALAETKLRFVSRGDDSGTHKKELALWQAAGLAPETFGPWYASVGAGMGAALNIAAGLDAYILSDRATWLSFGNRAGLALLFEGDPALHNQYSYLPTNPARHPHVSASQTTLLEQWLTSETARDLINSYEIGGTRLFTFNAR